MDLVHVTCYDVIKNGSVTLKFRIGFVFVTLID